MDILRITVRWSGWSGAPGYSNFFFSTDGGFWDGGLIGDGAEVAANNARSRVREAFFGIQSLLPQEVSLTIESEALVLDSDTGETLGFIEVEGLSLAGGSSTLNYSAAAGAVVNWRTNDYRFGRRIRGRTFLVPLSMEAFQTDGTINSSALSDLREFGDTMIGSGGAAEFGVWSRPRDGSGGVFATAVSSNVPDMTAVLRSRRD